jgi:hypothetical protein
MVRPQKTAFGKWSELGRNQVRLHPLRSDMRRLGGGSRTPVDPFLIRLTLTNVADDVTRKLDSFITACTKRMAMLIQV